MIKSRFGSILIFISYFLFVIILFNIDLLMPELIENQTYMKLLSALVFLGITVVFVLLNKKLMPAINLKSITDKKEQIKDEKTDGFAYDTILQAVNTFILVVDAKLDLIYINEFGKDILGELYRDGFLKINDFVDAGFLDVLNLNIETDSKTFYLETKIKTAKKKTIATSVFISKLYDNSDAFSGMVIAFNDISKQKRAELSLNNQINFSKQIFKTIPDVILITDMDLRVIFANKKAEDILAKNTDESRKIFNYLTQKAIENGFDEYLRQIITRGFTDKQINVQNPFISEGGFVDIEIVPLRSGKKTIGGLLLVKDITEWRNLTDELKNLENFNRKMINSSPYVIISVNEDDIVSGWNERGEEKFGIKADKIIGENLFKFFPAILIIRDEINEAKIIGEPTFLSDKTIELDDGKRLAVEITLYTVYSKDKNIVINIRDISELKKLESSLIHAKNMGSLGLLTSKIVHDLNNVLSGITGYTTLLDKKVKKDSEIRKYIDRLSASNERATEIIKQILSYSKSKKKKKELININELIVESAKLLKLRIGNSKVSLNLTDKSLIAYGNRTRFSQAIMNLFVNANDALLVAENPEIKVKTTFKQEIINKNPNEIVISISDNGIGIKEDQIEKIFDIYFTTKTEDQGTGLGLSNVKDIMDEFGGKISVKSKYGYGTEFIMNLPWSGYKNDIDTVKKVEISEKKEIKMKGKILLVDDEEIVRDIGVEILEILGIICITAIDGEDGIIKFEENIDDIELVILDVEMPKKQGNEVYDYIKRINPDMKILIASGYSKEYLEKDVFRKIIPEYIAKPFQLNELSKKISDMVK